jgi:hypothetical protein
MDIDSADSTLTKRCAKCMSPIAEPDWVVNKVMAYCADCATLLHLGESKESRMFNDPKGALPVSRLPSEEPPVPPDEIPLEEDIPELEP